MADQTADKQPQGFQNHIERVSVVGGGGRIGQHITEELLKTGKHKVTALTRADSANKLPEGVESKIIDYDDQSSIVAALQGQDALIITMAVTAPRDQQAKLIAAAAEANVRWVLPNEYGLDPSNEELGKDTFLGAGICSTRELIEKLGKSSWIGTACGFWYEYSLSSGPFLYGFDFRDTAVTFYDDGNTRITTTTLPQTGRAVAKVLSLPILPANEADKSLCLNSFRNKIVSVSSFKVSQKDIFDSVLRVTGTGAEDWKIEYEPVKERYREGLEEFQKGNRAGFGKLLYARGFYPDGSGDLEARYGLYNDVLGLPKEDLDVYTKLAVSMAETSPLRIG